MTNKLLSPEQVELAISSSKATIMVFIALGIAFVFNTDKPYWAAITASVLQTPYISATIKNGALRLLGTVIGAVAIIILSAFFIQDRWMFLIFLSLWVYICIFISKQFSSPLMLIAYTSIVLGTYVAISPDQYFHIIVSRITEISIGIITVTIVDALIFPNYAGKALDKTVNILLGQSKTLLQLAFSNDKNSVRNIRVGFIKIVINLHELLQLAIMDSRRVKVSAMLYQELLNQSQLLFRYTSIFQRLVTNIKEVSSQQEFIECIKHIMLFFEKRINHIINHPQQTFNLLDEKALFIKLHKQLNRLVSSNSEYMEAKLFSQIEQLVEYTGLINSTLNKLTLLTYKIYHNKEILKGYKKHRDAHVFSYKDRLHRALIPLGSILFFGIIWFQSTSDSASVMFIIGSVYSCFICYSKTFDGIDLVIGAFIGGLFALIALIFLPMTTTFLGMCVILFPFVLFTNLFKRLHSDTFKYRVVGYVFLVAVMPTQHMDYDPTVFINTWFSLLLTFSLLPLVAKIIYPVNPHKRYAYSISVFFNHFKVQLQSLSVQLREQRCTATQNTEVSINYNYFHETVFWENLLSYDKTLFQDLTNSLLSLNSIIFSLNKVYFDYSSNQSKNIQGQIIVLINEINHIFDIYASQFISVQYISKERFQEKTMSSMKIMVAKLQIIRDSALTQNFTANASITSRIILLVEELIVFRLIIGKIDLERLHEARF